MGVNRHLLFNTYRLLKKTGYVEKLNINYPCASILVFHRIGNTSSNSITTLPALFESLVKEIKNNYKPTPLQTVVENIKNLKPPDPKTVVITFDDAYEDTFHYAVPILLKYDIPATFFIASGYINTDRIYPWDAEEQYKFAVMKWEQVKELTRLGFEIGSHTVNHLNLGKSPCETIWEEMVRSKDAIENTIQKEVTLFAYPFGSKECIAPGGHEIARDTGYECCCTAYGGKVTEKSNPYTLHRIGSYPTLIEFMMELDNFMTYFDGKMSINLF